MVKTILILVGYFVAVTTALGMVFLPSVRSADATCIIDGQPAARHGDVTACGAVLLSSQANSVD